MATLGPAVVPILIPTPIAASITTCTIAPFFVDDGDKLSLLSSLGSTTTTAASLVQVPAEYSHYYQTAEYVQSLSDDELAELTNKIDAITIDNNKAKVYINTPNNKN